MCACTYGFLRSAWSLPWKAHTAAWPTPCPRSCTATRKPGAHTLSSQRRAGGRGAGVRVGPDLQLGGLHLGHGVQPDVRLPRRVVQEVRSPSPNASQRLSARLSSAYAGVCHALPPWTPCAPPNWYMPLDAMQAMFVQRADPYMARNCCVALPETLQGC